MTTTTKLPVFFFGHGSPMNITEQNDFTRMLQHTGRSLPNPLAILVISAHWVTQGSYVSTDVHNQHQHDFYGFPSYLYEVGYTPPGSPQAAARIMQILPQVKGASYRIDHGAWALLHHLFPDAKIPVLQLSIDRTLSFEEHFALGRALAPLRSEGILIVASGNVTHNLREVSFLPDATIPQWADKFDRYVAEAVSRMDINMLLDLTKVEMSAHIAHPTDEHYIPLLYALGSAEGDQAICLFEGFQNGSISMRSWQFGKL